MPRRAHGSISQESFEKLWKEWSGEYEALPEPKPVFMEWFATAKNEILTKQLMGEALLLGTKAGKKKQILQVILEHGKSKPKTIVEMNSGETEVLDLDRVFHVACEAKGIRAEDLVAFVNARRLESLSKEQLKN